MIVINFTHPLTPAQKAQLEALAETPITQLVEIPAQFDNARPFAEQVAALVDAVGLSAMTWQQEMILVNPPAFAPAATVLIAELHGRMGYFPALIRIRPVDGSTPPRFEVAEIINLQSVRAQARRQR